MNTDSQTDTPEKEHRHPTTRDELYSAAVDLVTRARREILICCPMLDPALYNRVALTEALGHFIARRASNRVRVVVEDTEHMLLADVRLVELTRRFSDMIQIHRLGELHRGLAEMFLVADGEHCLHQHDVVSLDATLDFRTPQLAIPLAHRFEAIWAASEPAPGLHTFRL
jgi:hypothetical protein